MKIFRLIKIMNIYSTYSYCIDYLFIMIKNIKMTKQIINQKLLKFFKGTPQNFEIIYITNYKEYIFYERYLGTQIKFFVDEKEYDHVDMDGRCFICKTNKYMFNLYLLLRIFIIYGRIEQKKIIE